MFSKIQEGKGNKPQSSFYHVFDERSVSRIKEIPNTPLKEINNPIRSEWTLHQLRYRNGKQAYKNMFNIFVMWILYTKDTLEYHNISIQISKQEISL